MGVSVVDGIGLRIWKTMYANVTLKQKKATIVIFITRCENGTLQLYNEVKFVT